MRSGFVFAVIFLLTATCAWSQRGGGGGSRGGRAPSGPTTVPDIGVRYGTVPTGPPPTSTSKPGHSAEEEQKVEFSSLTVLVQVPVVVTDKSGQHIHNLKKEDFEISENGKEQKVGAFEEINASTSPLPAQVSKPGEVSNLAVDPS